MAKICIGNHDERIHRMAADAGIPAVYLKNYVEVFDTPNWDWEYSFLVDGIFYHHGSGAGSQYPAFNCARSRGTSTVSGHVHSVVGINWLQGPGKNRIFGMNVGSGIDSDHIVMDYAKNHLRKSICSVGVVLDGYPYLEIMV